MIGENLGWPSESKLCKILQISFGLVLPLK